MINFIRENMQKWGIILPSDAGLVHVMQFSKGVHILQRAYPCFSNEFMTQMEECINSVWAIKETSIYREVMPGLDIEFNYLSKKFKTL